MITKTAIDYAELPNDLLDLAKSHLRVDGSFDDVYLIDAIKRAINWFERITGISVNAVTWEWSPDQSEFCDNLATVPVSPVDTFTVKDAADVDISANYKITTNATHGVGLYTLKGAYVSGMKISIPSGFATADDIEPGITDAILRYVAHLYENREILVPGLDTQTPGWMTDVIATYWMPRV